MTTLGKHYKLSKETRDKMSIAKIKDWEEGKYNNRNSKHSEETKRKIGLSNTGKIHTIEFRKAISERASKRTSDKNPFYGKHHTLEVRERMSKAHKGKIPKVNYVPELVKLRLQGLLKRPNKPEQKLINIINKYNLPFSYCGNGDIIIDGLNPDFIDNDGSKRIIEVFGDYWHSDKRRHMTISERKARFDKYGFQLKVIWEKELNTLDEKYISNLIRNW